MRIGSASPWEIGLPPSISGALQRHCPSGEVQFPITVPRERPPASYQGVLQTMTQHSRWMPSPTDQKSTPWDSSATAPLPALAPYTRASPWSRPVAVAQQASQAGKAKKQEQATVRVWMAGITPHPTQTVGTCNSHSATHNGSKAKILRVHYRSGSPSREGSIARTPPDRYQPDWGASRDRDFMRARCQVASHPPRGSHAV